METVTQRPDEAPLSRGRGAGQGGLAAGPAPFPALAFHHLLAEGAADAASDEADDCRRALRHFVAYALLLWGGSAMALALLLMVAARPAG